MLEKKNYNALDVFKLIAAYLILVLHVSPFTGEAASFIRQTFVIVAVPFFFAASGFLSYKKLKGEFKTAFSCCKKNWRLYIIWSLIYLPIVIYGWVSSDKSLIENLLYYVRDFVFEGSYLTIWFLNALAVAMLIEHLMLKVMKARTCFIVSIFFYFIACLLSSYNQLLVSFPFGERLSSVYYLIFSSTKNGLLFGFPLVSLGALLASKESALGLKRSIIGCCIFFGALIAEVLLRNNFFPQNKSVDFAIALLPFTWCALSLALSINLKDKTVKGENLYVYLRKLGILIFLTQRLFIFVINGLSVKLMISYPLINFALVTVGTTLFSMLIIHFSKKFLWLKKIY